jgi:hypothetical protein
VLRRLPLRAGDGGLQLLLELTVALLERIELGAVRGLRRRWSEMMTSSLP